MKRSFEAIVQGLMTEVASHAGGLAAPAGPMNAHSRPWRCAWAGSGWRRGQGRRICRANPEFVQESRRGGSLRDGEN